MSATPSAEASAPAAAPCYPRPHPTCQKTLCFRSEITPIAAIQVPSRAYLQGHGIRAHSCCGGEYAGCVYAGCGREQGGASGVRGSIQCSTCAARGWRGVAGA
eukprot:800189-Rhodomonas_salina.1